MPRQRHRLERPAGSELVPIPIDGDGFIWCLTNPAAKVILLEKNDRLAIAVSTKGPVNLPESFEDAKILFEWPSAI